MSLVDYTPLGAGYKAITGNSLGLSSLGLGPASADLGPSKQVIGQALGTEQQLGQQAQQFTPAGPQYNPYIATHNLGQQQDAINMLGQAAAGSAPSPAEIMLRQQAANDANQAFGMAAAAPGRSPGDSLRAALAARAGAAGSTDAQAAALRAQEMANARQQYVGALQGYGQQLQGQRQQDIGQYLGVQGNQIGALNAAGSAAGGYANASAANANSRNQFMGGMLQTGATALLSDEREKTDVTPADLDGLASSLKGFSFRYKNTKNGAGPRVGVMAQDVAKSDLGKRIVVGGKRLKLDIGNAVGAALAMSAEAMKRTQKAA